MAYEYPQTVAWTAARRKVGVMADLGEFPVAGVLRAEDIARARTFYTEVLGLKAMEASGPSQGRECTRPAAAPW